MEKVSANIRRQRDVYESHEVVQQDQGQSRWERFWGTGSPTCPQILLGKGEVDTEFLIVRIAMRRSTKSSLASMTTLLARFDTFFRQVHLAAVYRE